MTTSSKQPSLEQEPRRSPKAKSGLGFYRWAALVGIGGSAVVGGVFGTMTATALDGPVWQLAVFPLAGAAVGAVLGLWKLIPYDSLAIDFVLGLFGAGARG